MLWGLVIGVVTQCGEIKNGFPEEVTLRGGPKDV